MRAPHGYLAATFLGLGAVLTVGCDDPTGPRAPTRGAIEITVSTASADIDIDRDGYIVSIEGGRAHTVGVNGAVTIGALRIGTYLVRLDGLAVNCTVDGANPRAVEVIGDNAVSRISFSVSCLSNESGAGAWDY